MSIHGLDDISYVIIDIDVSEDDDDYDEYFVDFSIGSITLNVTFHYNERELMKYKLLDFTVDVVNTHKIELPEQEWLHTLLRSTKLGGYRQENIIIIPFSIWLVLMEYIPKCVMNTAINNIKIFSKYFSDDVKSHNAVIEYHKTRHYNTYQHAIESLNGDIRT